MGGSATTRTSSPCSTSARRTAQPYIVSPVHGRRRRRGPDRRRRPTAGCRLAEAIAHRRAASCRALAHAHRTRHRPPRPQARQRLADRGRHREDRRLRPRRRARPLAADDGGHDGRHRRLHAARSRRSGGSPTPAATSTRSARCSTRWSPAARRSSATTPSRSSGSTSTRRRSRPPGTTRTSRPALEALILRLLAKDPDERPRERRRGRARRSQASVDAASSAPRRAATPSTDANPLDRLAERHLRRPRARSWTSCAPASRTRSPATAGW